MFGREIILNKVAGGGAGCTDIVDNYDPFGGGGLALYQLNGDIEDSSPNNYTLTDFNSNVNLNYVPGVFGQGLSVTSTSDGGRLENTSIPNYLSQSFWIKVNSFSIDDDRVFSYSIRDQGGTNPEIVTSNGDVPLDNADSLPTGVWKHVVVVIDGTDLIIYYDGKFQNKKTVVSGTALSYQRLIFLSDQMSTPKYQIDQVRLFTVPLTPLEVEALYTEELCICDGTVDTLQILGDNSCIATYQLDGNANDLSGNYSGTPTDVSYGAGEFDLAGYYNGSSSEILLPSGAPFDDSDTIKTLSVWAKRNTLSSRVMFLGISDPQNAARYTVFQVSTTGVLSVSGRELSTDNSWLSQVSLTSDTDWHHYVFTYDGSTRKIYYDGQELTTTEDNNGSANSSSWISYPNYSSTVYKLGAYREVVYSDGQLDQVRIFNRAITAGEVETLFAEQPCTKDIPPASNQLVLGLSGGYVYGANGLVQPDASITVDMAVIYHPILEKHYSCQNDDSSNQATKIYESSDGGATWSDVNLPAGSIDGMGYTPAYDPLTEKIYFGRTRSSTLYVYTINNNGVIGYNTISNFHTGSSFDFTGTDYVYGWVALGTAQTNGGGYFFDKNLLDGSGSSITLNTSMRLLGGYNRLYGYGMNWDTGHYKSFSDNNDTWYYTTNGIFINQTFSETDLSYVGTITFENGAWFYVSKDRRKLYRGTVVDSSSSLIYTVTSGELSAVRYSPNESKYYLFDTLGNIHSSTDGINWSIELNFGRTGIRTMTGNISNFI